MFLYLSQQIPYTKSAQNRHERKPTEHLRSPNFPTSSCPQQFSSWRVKWPESLTILHRFNGIFIYLNGYYGLSSSICSWAIRIVPRSRHISWDEQKYCFRNGRWIFFNLLSGMRKFNFGINDVDAWIYYIVWGPCDMVALCNSILVWNSLNLFIHLRVRPYNIYRTLMGSPVLGTFTISIKFDYAEAAQPSQSNTLHNILKLWN